MSMPRHQLTFSLSELTMPTNKRKTKSRNARPKGANSRRRIMTILTGRAALRKLVSPAPQHLVTIHKMSAEQTISQAAAATLTNLFFMLNQCNFVPFRDAFQQYTITKVEVWFRPTFKANPASLDATYVLPEIYVAADPTDAGNWASISDAQSAENCVVMDDSEPFCVTLRPLPQLAAGKNAVFTGFSTIDAPLWVDTFDNDVRWFGLKIAISAAGGAATHFQRWDVQFRMFVTFRLGK